MTTRAVIAFIAVLLGLNACGAHNLIGGVAGIAYGAYQMHRAVKTAERDEMIKQCAPENRPPELNEYCRGKLHR